MASVSPVKKSPNVWKWVGLGCGGFLVVGIGAIVALGYFISSSMNLTMDPKTVEKEARKIMDYQLPGQAEGVMSMNMMGMQIAAVQSRQNHQEVTLFLSKVPAAMLEGGNGQNAQQQVEDKFAAEFKEDFRVTATRQATQKLCSQTVSVTITEGTVQTASGTAPALLHQAAIPHKGNLIVVAAMNTSQTKSTSQKNNLATTNTKIFQSLKCK